MSDYLDASPFSHWVFADESGQFQVDPYTVIGMVIAEEPLSAEHDLERLCARSAYRSEIKYSSTNMQSLPVRKAFIDYFAGRDDLRFQCIIQTKGTYDLRYYRPNAGQQISARALAYNHTYKMLFLHKLSSCDRVMAYIDERSRSSGDNLPEYLRSEVPCVGAIELVKSNRFRLLQLADLLTGATNGLLLNNAGGAKREIQDHFANAAGITDARWNSWVSKCGRWHFRPYG